MVCDTTGRLIMLSLNFARLSFYLCPSNLLSRRGLMIPLRLPAGNYYRRQCKVDIALETEAEQPLVFDSEEEAGCDSVIVRLDVESTKARAASVVNDKLHRKL